MDDKEYGTDAERAELISRIKFDLALLHILLAQHASQLSDQSVGHLETRRRHTLRNKARLYQVRR
jgi:hypothetical protein